MKSTDRRQALILLVVTALIAVASSVVLTSHGSENGDDESNGLAGLFHGMMRMKPCGPLGGWQHGGAQRGGLIEVSEEYTDNIINIAESDLDVQNLLSDGYSVIGVRPIITTKVDAEGNVTSKATNAIVTLQNEDLGSRASVWVNLEEEKVTKIVIFTMTIIEKS